MNCKVTCRLELWLTNKLYHRQRWNSSALVNLLSRPVGGRAGKCNLIHFIAHFSCDCWLSGWLKNPYPVSRCCGLADSSLTGLNGDSTVFDMTHQKNTCHWKRSMTRILRIIRIGSLESTFLVVTKIPHVRLHLNDPANRNNRIALAHCAKRLDLVSEFSTLINPDWPEDLSNKDSRCTRCTVPKVERRATVRKNAARR